MTLLETQAEEISVGQEGNVLSRPEFACDLACDLLWDDKNHILSATKLALELLLVNSFEKSLKGAPHSCAYICRILW